MGFKKDLYRAVLALGTVEECEQFFADLCTPGEIDAMADRWRVARLLDDRIPYREIYDRTGVSTATVTRVARCLSQGGGYRRMLDRIGGRKDSSWEKKESKSGSRSRGD